MLHKKIISIFLMILIIGSMNIEVKADVSNVIIDIGLNALAKQSIEVYTLALCIISKEACAGSIFSQALSKVSPDLAKTWSTISNPQQAVTSLVMQEVSKNDPKAAQSLQNVLEVNNYLQELFPDAKIETDKASTSIKVERKGQPPIEIRQPPPDAEVKKDKGRLVTTTKDTPYPVTSYLLIDKKTQSELSINEKTGDIELYLQKPGIFQFGDYKFENVKSVGDNPVAKIRLDEDGKVKDYSLTFQTTEGIKNLKIPGIEIDTKKDSRIYFNSETDEFDATDIEEARIGNVKLTKSVKAKFTDKGLGEVTLKTEGSTINIKDLDIDVEALGKETKIYFTKEDYDKDTSSKNKVLIFKTKETTRAILNGEVKFNDLEFDGKKGDYK